MPKKLVARATELRPPLRVIPFKTWCELRGFSERTGRRLIESGDGPIITQLTDRLIGVREDHDLQWLETRVR
jgi:hypothetical protein